MRPETSHLWRRARTAVGLPARVVACEDRMTALDQHVSAKLDEMRSELAEIRTLLHSQLRSDVESTQLLGQLLQDSRDRLEALEQSASVQPRPTST